MKEMIEEYGQPFEGLRAAPAALEDDESRLEIFLGIVDEEAPVGMDGRPQFKRVLWCIAENDEKDTLRFVKKQIDAAPEDKPISLYVHMIKGGYKFWFGGPDCFFKAIAVWKPETRRYQYLNPLYGTPWHEWLNMKTALMGLAKGAKAVKSVVP